jgi:riboflavin synthase
MRFTLEAPALLGELAVGDSVACEGVCLTVETLTPTGFTVCAVAETLALTNLASWRVGTSVNLEPALKAGSPLGGHFVLGHVDGVATSMGFKPLPEGGGEWFVRLPDALMRYCVSKGSVALCGTSLTIAGIEGSILRIALIPHTLAHTTLGQKRDGDRINVEVDVLAKHIERLLSAWQPHSGSALSSASAASPVKEPASQLNFASLAQWGFAPASAVESASHTATQTVTPKLTPKLTPSSAQVDSHGRQT